MPPAAYDLSPYRARIQSWKQEKITNRDILALLAAEGVTISLSFLEKRLKSWNVRVNRQNHKRQDLPSLRIAITRIFHEQRLSDDETVQRLALDGYQVGPKTVARIRKDIGLKKQLGPHQFEAIDDEIRRVLTAELLPEVMPHNGVKGR